MNEVAEFLYKWQPLAGAVLGGLFGVVAALVVAYKARRQEDLAAGMLLIGNLVTFQSAKRTLEQLLAEKEVKKENVPYWYAEKLARRRLQLSPVFEASRVRLMPVDTHLAVHLELFQLIVLDIDSRLDRLEADIRAHDATERTNRKPEALRADARIIYQGFQSAVAHAACAERILTYRVLSKYPTFNQIRRRFFPSKQDRACEDLLIDKSKDGQ
ncbi:hypothetical protein Thimo_0900 [Thioflavicoccus mobilis 8321]|uniref:Uncharacterized protein n=1 Tax=Thioflavicoccus mobilis 8321 TaxID=765912 RepID=L0GUP5_9GAMM|nr:hypothetical protein [Thioflavicoccus mobilis]AGA89731.1 hypothetical protein Thimo_0900 [Thioflavicoccus mobilis 8321]